ncbi:hypothetical protein ABKN59_005441 [Abortiporus biennis]
MLIYVYQLGKVTNSAYPNGLLERIRVEYQLSPLRESIFFKLCAFTITTSVTLILCNRYLRWLRDPDQLYPAADLDVPYLLIQNQLFGLQHQRNNSYHPLYQHIFSRILMLVATTFWLSSFSLFARLLQRRILRFLAIVFLIFIVPVMLLTLCVFVIGVLSSMKTLKAYLSEPGFENPSRSELLMQILVENGASQSGDGAVIFDSNVRDCFLGLNFPTTAFCVHTILREGYQSRHPDNPNATMKTILHKLSVKSRENVVIILLSSIFWDASRTQGFEEWKWELLQDCLNGLFIIRTIQDIYPSVPSLNRMVLAVLPAVMKTKQSHLTFLPTCIKNLLNQSVYCNLV